MKNIAQIETTLIDKVRNILDRKHDMVFDESDESIHKIITIGHGKGIIANHQDHETMRQIYTKIGFTQDGKITLAEQKRLGLLRAAEIEHDFENKRKHAIEKIEAQILKLKDRVKQLQALSMKDSLSKAKAKAVKQIKADVTQELKQSQKKIMDEVHDLEHEVVPEVKMDLNKFTVKDLKAMMLARGLHPTSKMNKSQIIGILER